MTNSCNMIREVIAVAVASKFKAYNYFKPLISLPLALHIPSAPASPGLGAGGMGWGQVGYLKQEFRKLLP